MPTMMTHRPRSSEKLIPSLIFPPTTHSKIAPISQQKHWLQIYSMNNKTDINKTDNKTTNNKTTNKKTINSPIKVCAAFFSWFLSTMTIKYTYLSLCHLSVWTLSILLKPVLPERTTLVPDERKIHLQDTNKMKRQTLCQAQQFSSKAFNIQVKHQ